jgi:polyferredoxin
MTHMARFRWKNVNTYRKPIQLVIIGLLAYMVVRLFTDPSYGPDFEAYCPFGGMQALASFAVSETLACSMTSMQIAMGIMLVIGVILFSKLFCSFICPIGTFTEWLGQIGEKLKMRYTIRGIADRVLRSLKYALLFATFYLTIEASELFCREWDPFYAVFTGFGHDVDVWYAGISLAVVVLGSVFVRQFWCKYLCPLSAATNLFALLFIPVSVLAVYGLLAYLGITLHWMYPILAVVIIGYAAEAGKLKTGMFPLMKIERVDSICSGCKKCDKVCPMGIEISVPDKVYDIDCHLCTDCIQACPDKGALTINKKNWQWFPGVATIGLIAAGLWFGNAVHIPTITERWGSEDEFARAEIYEQSGLRSIKCFGSSKSFATKMRDVPGVLGAQTFVGSHSVKVWFDPDATTAEAVQDVMFSPQLMMFQDPGKDITEVAVTKIGVDKLFDTYDHSSFEILLSQIEGLYLAESQFGEPVQVSIYFDAGKTNAEEIASRIAAPTLTYLQEDVEINEDLNFGASVMEDTKTMSVLDFQKVRFVPEDWSFNSHDETIGYEVYEIAFPQALETDLAEQVPYLVSHLSNDEGIVRFVTNFEGDIPVALIYYIGEISSREKIFKLLTKADLHVFYDDGDSEHIANPFTFKEENEGNTEPVKVSVTRVELKKATN